MTATRLLVIATGLLMLTGPAHRALGSRPHSEIVVCGGLVPAGLAEANATFQVFYEVETDSAGRIQRVSKLRNTILPDEALVDCLKRWTLPAPEARAKVSLRWTHARGLTQLTIAMPGFTTRTITIDPGWQ